MPTPGKPVAPSSAGPIGVPTVAPISVPKVNLFRIGASCAKVFKEKRMNRAIVVKNLVFISVKYVNKKGDTRFNGHLLFSKV